MDHCPRCPVAPGSPCLGPELGLCVLLEGPDAAAWSRHVVARSQSPPPSPRPAPGPPPARIGPRLALVLACDRRGPQLADRPTGCGCPPLRRCADGRDVSLNDCLECVRGDPGA